MGAITPTSREAVPHGSVHARRQPDPRPANCRGTPGTGFALRMDVAALRQRQTSRSRGRAGPRHQPSSPDPASSAAASSHTARAWTAGAHGCGGLPSSRPRRHRDGRHRCSRTHADSSLEEWAHRQLPTGARSADRIPPRADDRVRSVRLLLPHADEPGSTAGLPDALCPAEHPTAAMKREHVTAVRMCLPPARLLARVGRGPVTACIRPSPPRTARWTTARLRHVPRCRAPRSGG
jgi:hypothetical protein